MKGKLNDPLFTYLVSNWMEHLAPGHRDFEELLNLSKVNRRVRNVFVFYTLSNPHYFVRFEELSRSDQTLQMMRYELARALKRLENEKDEEIHSFAKRLRNRYFRHMQLVVEEEKYDVSAEMAKFFKTMLTCYRLASRDTEEKHLERRKRFNNFDLSVLN